MVDIIQIKEGYVHAKTSKKTKGTYIYLGGEFGSSVLATDNVMMTAVLTKGKTVIEAASCEPEVVDLANFLIKMGAKIKGHGTPIIEIDGVESLHGTEHSIIPDRIEAGTFMIAAAITKGDVTIKGAEYQHLGAVIDKLTSAGLYIKRADGDMRINGNRRLHPVNRYGC